MTVFSFFIYDMLFGMFVYTSSELQSVHGKSYYVAENKTDHVTSKEFCSTSAGKLVHADSILNVSSFIKKLNLSAHASYWIDGSGPTYISTPSCLLLSRNIMTVGCNQLHYFICEFDSLLHTISPTRSKDYVISDLVSSNLDLSLSTHDISLLLQTSYLYHPETSTADFGWNTTTTASQHQRASTTTMVGPISARRHILPTLTHSSSSEVQSIVGVHSKTSVTSLYTTQSGAWAQHALQGNVSSTKLMCYRFCLSLNISEFLHMSNNILKPSPDRSSSLNDSLKINVKQTSKAIRKLTSAWDSRTSSKAIGGFAIAVITAVPVCIILIDIPLLLRHLRAVKSKL